MSKKQFTQVGFISAFALSFGWKVALTFLIVLILDNKNVSKGCSLVIDSIVDAIERLVKLFRQKE